RSPAIHMVEGTDGPLWTFVFPPFVMPGNGIFDVDGNEIGFVVIGDAAIAGADFVLPDLPGNESDMRNGEAGLILRNPSSEIVDAMAWEGEGDLTTDDPGPPLNTTGAPSSQVYLHVVADDDSDDDSLQVNTNVYASTGGSWQLAPATPGFLNSGQSSAQIDLGPSSLLPSSPWNSMSLAGNFNGFDPASHPMTLVADNQWQITVTNVHLATNTFRFIANTNPATGAWGDTNQADTILPLTESADSFPGANDIRVEGEFSGEIRFTFNDQTLTYNIIRSAPNSLAFSANVNGYDTTPNMTRIGPSLWSLTRIFTNYTDLEFRFVPDSPPAFWWGDSGQTDFKIPVFADADADPGATNIVVPENLNGNYTITFDTATFDVRVLQNQASLITNVWINEIDYEQPTGSDPNEWVELAGPAGLSLDNYRLKLVEGPFAPYYEVDLAEANFTFADETNGVGFFVIGKVTPSFGDPADYRPPDWNSDVIRNEIGPGFAGQTIILERKSDNMSVHVVDMEQDNGYMSHDQIAAVNDSTATEKSVYLSGGPGTNYNDFTWATTVFLTSPGEINPAQTFVVPSAPAVIITNAATTPLSPLESDPVFIEADIIPTNGAHNLDVIMHYRIGTVGPFTEVGMTNVGNHYTSSNAIAPQPLGSVVQYYIAVCYSQPGAADNVLAYFPSTAPAQPAEYTLARVSVDDVWINEMNTVEAVIGAPDNEYIELVGRTGADLTGWSVEILDNVTNVIAIYTFTNLVVLNDDNGFGFVVLGDSAVNNVDVAFTHPPVQGNSQIPERGAVRLRNEIGVVIDQLSFGAVNMMSGFEYIGAETDGAFVEDLYALTGCGSVYEDFSWVIDGNLTPGMMNVAQTLKGGNTNPIPPLLYCNES
ncbi:MAG: hypothetical protein AAF492_07825, partial [Verrucomicrobiota bacterium]